MELNTLFKPIKIGNLNLRNRIVMSPMATKFVENGEVNHRLKDFYEERAKGGVGFIGIALTPNRLDNDPPFPGIYDDRFIPGLEQLVEICHRNDVKVFAELIVPYSWAFPGRPVELVSPSGITITGRVEPPFRSAGPPPGTCNMRRPLSEPEISEMVEAYGDASRRAREAGFDGVQFMGATGYLVSQFLSPLTNKRTDKYGGSLENRMRFLLEQVENSKEKAGKDWTYLARMSAQWTKNGITFDDLKDMAAMLEKAGFQAIDVLPGWHEEPVPMVAPATPQGKWAYIAEELKKAVKIPIGAGSQIQDPVVANRILEEGKADYIYMCRALIADPQLPIKAKEGRLDDICPCVTCSCCLEAVTLNKSAYCTVNPRAGREREYVIEKVGKAKKVFVIGGGPAGIESGIVAAKRGHKVTLFERHDQLGGQLNSAAIPPYKDRIAKFKEYLLNQIRKVQIKVELNKELTPELAEKERPDIVILATGAIPVIPNITGVEGTNVITALDVLNESKEIGEKVVIIGGGTVGCETAEFLALKGKKVTVLEMLERLARDESTLSRWHLLLRMKEIGIRAETNVKAIRIDDKGVVGARSGKSEIFEADTVVLAAGMKGNLDLVNRLKGKAAKIYFTGDCLEPRKIAQAMNEGFLAGLKA